MAKELIEDYDTRIRKLRECQKICKIKQKYRNRKKWSVACYIGLFAFLNIDSFKGN